MGNDNILPVGRRSANCACGTRFAIGLKGRPPKHCPDCLTASTVVVDSDRWAECACGTRFQVKRMGRPPKQCPGCRPANSVRAAAVQTGYYVKNVKTPEREPINCAGCGTRIELVRMGYKRERCDTCTASRTTVLSAIWDQEHPEKRAVRSRRSKKKRRAAKRGVECEVFEPREVFDRDRWICQICGWKISPATPYPNDRYPTLDHVVPLSQGGSHTRANTRLACWICNCRRGERGGNEQLALI